MKRYVIRLLSIVFAVFIGLVGFAPTALAGDSLSGNYRQDTIAVVEGLRTAINLPDNAPDKKAAQAKARQLINDFAARYRRDGSVAKLTSFTTMRTALNSLAGHYSSYPNRPVPQKLKDRLEQEFKQVELAVNRGN
jgi:photosystem II Psb27 protein